MHKKIITALSILILLTGCGANRPVENKPGQSVENNKENVKQAKVSSKHKKAIEEKIESWFSNLNQSHYRIVSDYLINNYGYSYNHAGSVNVMEFLHDGIEYEITKIEKKNDEFEVDVKLDVYDIVGFIENHNKKDFLVNNDKYAQNITRLLDELNVRKESSMKIFLDGKNYNMIMRSDTDMFAQAILGVEK